TVLPASVCTSAAALDPVNTSMARSTRTEDIGIFAPTGRKTKGRGRTETNSHSPLIAIPVDLLRSARFRRGELPEVGFNHLAILGRHVAGQFLHRLGTFFGRQRTPLLGQAF